MSRVRRILGRTTVAAAATAVALTGGLVGSASAPADSFTAIIGGAAIGPLSVPGISAGPSGADLGVFRVPVPAPLSSGTTPR